jgi:hypothetical protein
MNCQLLECMVYYLQGYNSGSAPQSIVFYAKLNNDGTTGAWSTNSNALPAARIGAGVTTINGYVYTIGGVVSGTTATSTVYYASNSRITVGGSLDLVGLSGQNLADPSAGGSLTAGNTIIAGTLNVQGQAVLSGSLSVERELFVAGGATFKNSIDSSSSFQVQNSGGAQLLNIDATNTATTTLSNNAVTNGSFEDGATTTGWAARTAATLSQDSNQFYIGKKSLSVATTAAVDGAKYTLTTTTVPSNTKFNLNFAARMAPGNSMATLQAGYSPDNTTGSEVNCFSAGQSVTSNGWTNFSCTFTTGTTSSTPYIYIKQTDSTARTIYIDAVQLTRFSILANASVEQAVSASDWQKKTGSETSVARDTTEFVDGAGSVKTVTTAAVNQGVKQNITLADNTNYTLSFYAKNTGAAFTDMAAGYSSDGSTDTNCMSAQTVVGTSTVTANWTKYTCTFVTPGFHSGTPYIYIKQAAATAHTFFVDVVQLTQGNPVSSYKEGLISLNGIVESSMVFQNQTDSTSAFQIQNASGYSLMQVDTVNSAITLLGSTGELGPWQTSTTVFPGSETREETATFIANGYIYALGGFGVTGNTAQSTSYYAKLNANGSLSGATWSSTTALPLGLDGVGAATANGYVYVVGGINSAGAAQSSVYYAKLNADGTIGSWNTTASLPAIRGSLKSVVLNGYIYAIAGSNTNLGSGAQSSVYYAKLNADGTVGAWNTTGTLTNLIWNPGATTANGYIYVTGGENSSFVEQTTIQYARPNADGSVCPGALQQAVSQTHVLRLTPL